MTTLPIGSTVCKGPRTLLALPEPETLPDKRYLRKLIRANGLIAAGAVDVSAIADVEFSALQA